MDDCFAAIKYRIAVLIKRLAQDHAAIRAI